jgi:transcriptional regulator with XRE-family HTH domain
VRGEESGVPPTEFGTFLRRLRDAASLSQEELARRAGLSAKAISALERGERRRPYPHTVRALADALDLSPLQRDALQAAASGRLASAPAGSPNGEQRDAAWEIYVELTTRVAVIELTLDQGMLREALTSLHSLFGTTRGILRHYGPALAEPPGDGTQPLDRLATSMLNEVLRPVLSRWHPLLLDHENRRPTRVTEREHEQAWSRNDELRAALRDLQAVLVDYARSLAAIAGVPAR